MSDQGPYPRGRSLAANLPYLHGGTVDFGEAIRQGFRNGFVYRAVPRDRHSGGSFCSL